MTDYMMKYLAKVEGTKIHYNETESDITTMYGIYRVEHPNAEIFNIIDIIAEEINLPKNSSIWVKEDIDVLNDYIESNGLTSVLYNAAKEFYTHFLKKIELDLFPLEAQVAVFSLYTNSPKRAVISIQTGINKFIENNFISTQKLVIDGDFGRKSKNAIKLIHNGYLFEAYILLEMSKQYATLAVNNPDKYLKYLNGWNNRLSYLSNF